MDYKYQKKFMNQNSLKINFEPDANQTRQTSDKKLSGKEHDWIILNIEKKYFLDISKFFGKYFSFKCKLKILFMM